MVRISRLVRVLSAASAPLLLAGCLDLSLTSAKTPEPAAITASSSPATIPATETDPNCYTVDLFSPQKIRKPAKDVPESYRAFLGHWSRGAWNNVWCHDLLIYAVHKDGRVELVEMHAPYKPWNQPATAFNRVARIGEDGSLGFSQGVERTTYRLENGFLVGTRSGLYGDLKITLYQGDPPPLPQPKPLRLAQAQGDNSGG